MKMKIMKALGTFGILLSIALAADKEAQGHTTLVAIEPFLVPFAISVILLFIGIIIGRKEPSFFSFSNTTGRLEYFFISLGLYLLFVFSIVMTASSSFSAFAPLVILFIIIPLVLANICRRLNDIGKSRYFALITFIPFVNLIFILYLLFVPNKKIKK